MILSESLFNVQCIDIFAHNRRKFGTEKIDSTVEEQSPL